MKIYPIPTNKKVILWINETPLGKLGISNKSLGVYYIEFGNLRIKFFLHKQGKNFLNNSNFIYNPLRFQKMYPSGKKPYVDLWGYIYLGIHFYCLLANFGIDFYIDYEVAGG